VAVDVLLLPQVVIGTRHEDVQLTGYCEITVGLGGEVALYGCCEDRGVAACWRLE